MSALYPAHAVCRHIHVERKSFRWPGLCSWGTESIPFSTQPNGTRRVPDTPRNQTAHGVCLIRFYQTPPVGVGQQAAHFPIRAGPVCDPLARLWSPRVGHQFLDFPILKQPLGSRGPGGLVSPDPINGIVAQLPARFQGPLLVGPACRAGLCPPTKSVHRSRGNEAPSPRPKPVFFTAFKRPHNWGSPAVDLPRTEKIPPAGVRNTA